MGRGANRIINRNTNHRNSSSVYYVKVWFMHTTKVLLFFKMHLGNVNYFRRQGN
jgi:hypothetical protein